MATAMPTTKTDLLAAFAQTRARTAAIFNWVHPDAYEDRPIALRHPIVFYEGHMPAFVWNTLFGRVLNRPPFNADFNRLFARGIDPGDAQTAEQLTIRKWPPREAIQAYGNTVWQHLESFLTERAWPEHPLLENNHILQLLLEHEMMHQETLLYILHRLPHDKKILPPGVFKTVPRSWTTTKTAVTIPAGQAQLGVKPGTTVFAWDNESPALAVDVPEFEVDTRQVTNGAFLAFIEAGGYENPAYWSDTTWAWKSSNNITHPPFWSSRDGDWWLVNLFENIPLPLDCPVYVTYAEAEAYARFIGKVLPTEAQWDRAVYGDSEAPYPWGETAPDETRGNFDFNYAGPKPVGAFPAGRSRTGLDDTLGNGWEWTSTPFAPFPGFIASEGYPQYSADFFDGKHYVLKGGGPFTDARLLRRSFRNWFYWDYPHVHATFRCASPG